MATKKSQTAKNVKKNVNEAVDTVDEQTQKAGQRIRRAVLAYLGMYGVAYDEAQTRVKAFRENRKDWFDRLVEKGEEMETQASELMEDAQARVEENTAKLRDALNLGDNVVEMKVKTKKPAAKKTTAKKKTAKKPSAKKTAAKKSASKTTTAKKTTTRKATVKTPVGKASVEAKVKSDAPKTTKTEKTVTSVTGSQVKPDTADKYDDYWTDVKRYDSSATKTNVKKIVDHLGIALESQDSMYVACSDETERNTVRDSWMKKKLSIEGTDEALDKKVMAVCEEMKDDHMKKRVTFYYLVAKNEGALMFL